MERVDLLFFIAAIAVALRARSRLGRELHPDPRRSTSPPLDQPLEVDRCVRPRRPEPPDALATAPPRRIVGQENDQVLIRGETGQNEVTSAGRRVKLKFDKARRTLPAEPARRKLNDIMKVNSPGHREDACVSNVCRHE